MMRRILDKLEDPKSPLLGPNIKALKFWGLLLPKNKALKWFYIILHTAIPVFLITEFIEVWFVRSDIKVLLQNLEISMISTMTAFKLMSFLNREKDWQSIIDYVTEADLNQRDTEDRDKLNKIRKFTRYSRKLTYTLWSLTCTTCIACIATPTLKYYLSVNYREGVRIGTVPYTEVISSWVPFDKKAMKGYLAACLYQSYAAIFGGGGMSAFDSLGLVLMVFFRAELELLRMDAAKIFEKKNNEEIKRRIRICHKRHTELVKHFRLYNSYVSHLLMIYIMFVCSFMICVTIYQLSIEPVLMEKFIAMELLVFDIAQLFMYCWQSNQILYASQDLMLGPYESGWYDNDVIHRKDLYILTRQFQKTLVVSAGPFTDLNLATFISILKAAYSYYALLSNVQIQ